MNQAPDGPDAATAPSSPSAGKLLADALAWATWGVAGMGLLLGLAAALSPRAGTAVMAGSAAMLVGAVAVALVRRHLAVQQPQRALAAVLLIIVVGVTLHAVFIGLGVHSVVLGGYAIVVAVAGQFFGWRRAALAALGCFGLVLALAGAETLGWFDGEARLASMSTAHRVLAHAVLLALALVTGWSLGALLQSALDRARAGEQRFRSVLSLAADWYWEQDREFRFTRVEPIGEKSAGFPVEDVLGRRRWEIEAFVPDQQGWAAHQALLQAHRPFSDLRLTRRHPDGESTHMSVSGEPMIDARGRFTGYWGVGRDVTSEEQARLRLEAMLRHAMVGIAFTQDRCIRHVNDQFAHMLGWPAHELTGQPGSVVWLDEADYAEVGRQFGPRLAGGEGVEFERLVRRRDGSTLLAHIRASAIDPSRPAEGGTIWVAEDITQQREAEQALAMARDAAEAASQAKSRFLANISHEIRTPLNGVIGLARLAQAPHTSPERQREYLERIDDCARTLSDLIADVLDLSKIEAGKLTLEATDFDLHELLQSVHASHHLLAQAKGLSCTLELDPALPRKLHGDPVRLRQILANLMANAVKFTERGGIGLRAWQAADADLNLEVHDTGIGIDGATLGTLFAPFTQADQSTTRRFGGTGLGLSICRELARLMHGDIDAHSEPGTGSRFVLSLPLPRAQPLPSSVSGQAASGSSGLFAPVEQMRGLRVLLVEDNPVNMMIAQTMLQVWGVEVLCAHDGHQALQQVHEHGTTLDLVLMDVHMPVMSGHEATARIRELHSAEQLPIVALTAAALTSEREQSQALGMNDFLTKPFEAERLRELVLKWGRRAGHGTGDTGTPLT